MLTGLTGSILVFQTELDVALNPDLWRLRQPGAERVLSAEEMARIVEAADPRVRARWIPAPADPDRAADIWVDWKADPATGLAPAPAYNQVFVDPTSGTINGRRTYAACCLQRQNLIPFLHQLHSALYIPGSMGMIILGLVAIAWMMDSVFGFYLTLPRGQKGRAFWSKWKTAWTIKPRASAERRVLDLHRAPGLWIWALLFVTAVSSLAVTLKHEVFEPAVNIFSSITEPAYEARPMRGPADVVVAALTFDDAVARATTAARAADIQADFWGAYDAAELGVYGVAFGDEANPGIGPSWIYLDSTDGRILDVIPATGGTAGDVFTRMQLPLHTGNIGGIATRILMCAAGLTVALLSITGVLIWARKRRAAARAKARGGRSAA